MNENLKIQDKNIRIAVFMGGTVGKTDKHHTIDWEETCKTAPEQWDDDNEYSNILWCFAEGLRYHFDWHWLMQVVEKIHEIGTARIVISNNIASVIPTSEAIKKYVHEQHFCNDKMIILAYNAVYSFVEKYLYNKDNGYANK